MYCWVSSTGVLTLYSIPEDERKRCVLLPDNEDHSASPFNDASRTGFIDRTQQLPRLPFEAATHFRGREVRHVVSPLPNPVISISVYDNKHRRGYSTVQYSTVLFIHNINS